MTGAGTAEEPEAEPTDSNPRLPFRLADLGEPRMPAGEMLAHVVVNIEAWPFDQPMPRGLLPAPHGAQAVPDVPNFSWVEYGMRCGLPRIMRLCAEIGATASASLNAAVLDRYPGVAEALAEAGWEVIAHGWTQRGLTADDEAEVVSRSLDRIERATGQRPRCWLGPGLKETTATPDVLARAGITTLFDWTVDDLPLWMATTEGPLLAVPYSLELNDSVIYAVGQHATGELERRVAATLEVYGEEAQHEGRLVTIGLHPHLMGVPHRVAELRRVLHTAGAACSGRFINGSGIDAWFRSANPPQDHAGGRAAPARV